MAKFTLRELREKFNKTQVDLAQVIDKSISAYNMIENGKRKLSLEDAIKITKYYGIKVEDIFFDDEFNAVLKNKDTTA